MSRHTRPDRKQQRRDSAKERQTRFDAMDAVEKRKHLEARGCPTTSNEFRKLGLTR